MHAEVVSMHVCSDRKGFKTVDEKFINVFFKLLEDLSSKCEMLSHCSAFMVTTKHDATCRVVQLEGLTDIIGLTFKE